MTDSTPSSPSYEDAREELIEVVRRLEAGGTTLEESLALWERGEALARSARLARRRQQAPRRGREGRPTDRRRPVGLAAGQRSDAMTSARSSAAEP